MCKINYSIMFYFMIIPSSSSLPALNLGTSNVKNRYIGQKPKPEWQTKMVDSNETAHDDTSHLDLHRLKKYIQYNLNDSNPDGSFTLDDSNSFISPYKILPIAQENKYLEIFSYSIMELYVVCTH